MKACIYKRVSTTIQVTDGASLEVQEERLKAYIIAQGWELVHVYEDAGLSGSDTNRPAFQQMLADAENKRFDCIVVYKLDRLTRSVKDFHDLSEKLDKLKISIVSVTQNLDTSSPVGRLLRNILIDFANFEREMIKERSMDSKYALAEKGVWLGGHPPYGYKVSDKKLVVDQAEALVVKDIYDQYLKGESMRQIMRNTGVKLSHIERILWNPVYCGLLGYSKTKRKPGDKEKQRKNMDEWIICQGEHEPIISREVFETVKAMKEKKIAIPGSRNGEAQIFDNVCYCSCGLKMYYFHHGNPKGIYRYYRCNRNNHIDTGCGLAVREQWIEEKIVTKLSELMNDRQYWKTVEKQANASSKKDVSAVITKLEEEYKKNKTSIANLIIHMSMESGQEIAYLITPQIKQLEKRQQELTKLIESKKQEGYKEISIHNTQRIITDHMKYWHKMTRSEKRAACKILINKLMIHKDKVILKLNDENFPEIIC
jgi:site-specific DNA recombinase